MRLKSPALPLFTQPFIRMQIKGNIKALRHWPLCGEVTETGEFPAQMASNAEKVSILWRHHEQRALKADQAEFRNGSAMYDVNFPNRCEV